MFDSEPIADWARLAPAERIMLDAEIQPIIATVVRVEGFVDSAWANEHIVSHVALQPRMRCVVSGNGFVPDPKFEKRTHVTQHDKVFNHSELDRLLSIPMDTGRELWHLHVYAPPAAAYTELVFIVAHIVGDGAAMAVLFQGCLAELPPRGHEPVSPGPPLPPRKPVHPNLLALGARPSQLEENTQLARDMLAAFVLPFVPDQHGVFLGDNAAAPGERTTAFCRPRSIRSLRIASRRVGVTINDMLAAALSGALRRHTAATHPNGARISAGVPVNLRVNSGLRNTASCVHLRLATSEMTVAERLAHSRHRMRDALGGWRACFVLLALFLVSLLPFRLRRFFTACATAGVTLGFTNVAGPPRSVLVGDREVQDVRPVPAGFGTTGVVACAFSYDDTLHVSFCADRRILAKVKPLAAALDEEFDQVLSWIESISHVTK